MLQTTYIKHSMYVNVKHFRPSGLTALKNTSANEQGEE